MNANERNERIKQRFCDDDGFLVVPLDAPAFRIDGRPLTNNDLRDVEEMRHIQASNGKTISLASKGQGGAGNDLPHP